MQSLLQNSRFYSDIAESDVVSDVEQSHVVGHVDQSNVVSGIEQSYGISDVATWDCSPTHDTWYYSTSETTLGSST